MNEIQWSMDYPQLLKPEEISNLVTSLIHMIDLFDVLALL